MEPGEFCMGSRGENEAAPEDCPNLPEDPDAQDDEKPPHRVRITKPFRLARYEVTREEYERFTNDTGKLAPDTSGFGADLQPEQRKRLPVINVTWQQATDYAKWLKEKTGKGFRLPSEAEWEYAARSGSQGVYPWGDSAGETGKYAWFSENSGGTIHPVGEKDPTGKGLYDLAGNVREWVADCNHDSYRGAPAGPEAWDDGTECASGRRVIRGGSWTGDPGYLRSASRYWNTPDFRYGGLGFRLTQDF